MTDTTTDTGFTTDQAEREASGAHPYGRYLEEFEVGAVYKHWPAKTVTEADDHLFCLITMNHHPLHINDVYAAQSQQGRNVVVGPLVYSLALGMCVGDVSGKAIANLATEELSHPNPVFHGDTLFVETEVLEKKESQSQARPRRREGPHARPQPGRRPGRRVQARSCWSRASTRASPRPSRKAVVPTDARPGAAATSQPCARYAPVESRGRVVTTRPLGRSRIGSAFPVSAAGGRPVVSEITVPTKNEKLIAWVEEIAALTKPDAIHWCDGSAEEYDRLCQLLVDAGTFEKLSDAKRPNSYLALVGPRRRRARRGPHLHLLRARGRRRPDEQLARPRPRCARCSSGLFDGCDARAARCTSCPFSMGPLGSDKSPHRRPAHRLRLRRRLACGS